MNQPILVASGLPRSGTSMLMQMLQAGGVDLVTDSARGPDRDNPRGYFEDERVKHLDHDTSWLAEARGKAIKVVSPLLKSLPPGHSYLVLFMRRSLSEIAASQARMLESLGSQPSDSLMDISNAMRSHLEDADAWLKVQPNMETLFIDHAEAVRDPLGAARSIAAFLSERLDTVLDVKAMAAAVDPSLRRQRAEDLPREPETATLAIPLALYDRVVEAAASAGVEDVGEFAAMLLDQALGDAPSPPSQDDDEAIRRRLQSLGYL